MWPINGKTLGSHFSQLAPLCRILKGNVPQSVVLLALPIKEMIFLQTISSRIQYHIPSEHLNFKLLFAPILGQNNLNSIAPIFPNSGKRLEVPGNTV